MVDPVVKLHIAIKRHALGIHVNNIEIRATPSQASGTFMKAKSA